MAMVNYGAMMPNAGQGFLGMAQGLQQMDINRAQEQRAAQNQQFKVEDRQLAQEQKAEKETKMGVASDLILNGTPDEVAAYGIENPEIMDDLIKMGEYRDKTNTLQRVAYLEDVLSGSVDPIEAATVRADAIDARGGDSRVLRGYIADGAQAVLDGAKTEFAVVAPDKYQGIYGKPEAPMTEFQRKSLELRKGELDLAERKSEQTKVEKQTKVETEKAVKNAEKAQVLESSVKSVNDTLSDLDSLISHKGLTKAVGWQGKLPTAAGTDASDFEIALESFVSSLTMENMEKMKGVLSDSDIKMIKAASAGLDVGMSEAAFKKRLTTIRKRIADKLETKKSQLAKLQPQPTQQTGGAGQTYTSTGGVSFTVEE